MLDADKARQLLDPAADAARSLREALDLISLSPAERRACAGKWLGEGLHFAGTAARVRERHGVALADVPVSAEEIRRQMARVLGLELSHGTLLRLCQDSGDTLLKERTRLYEMAQAVLQAVTWHGECPTGRPAERDAFSVSRAELRRHFDRRNRKVSQSKRARLAAPKAPALLPPGPAVAPPLPLGPVTILQLQIPVSLPSRKDEL